MVAPPSVVIHPARNVEGLVRVPGDKSISHRYAMLAAIARGTSRFYNFSAARDCANTLDCIGHLGAKWRRAEADGGIGRAEGEANGVVKIDRADAGAIEVVGIGPRLSRPSRALDCGNSGSTMRMLSGILAGQDFTTELLGDESLSRRPMARIIKPLSEMGARISSSDSGRPPLKIHGGSLRAIHYKPEVASAQVKSCVLFAGLFAQGETVVEEPIRTRDHGELALQAFGAEVEHKKVELKKDGGRSNTSRIRGGQALSAIEARVPGDLSSAAFFLCAAAIFPSSHISLPGVLLNPTRARLLDILVQMGLQISITQVGQHHGELIGAIEARGAKWLGGTIAGADTAALIDEISVLAAIAPYSENGLEVRDAQELRVKESDRIAAVATNLRKMGAEVEERPDGLRIPGRQRLHGTKHDPKHSPKHGAELDSFGDHRIAMAFAVAALRADGETAIHNADAAGVSYPGFFADLSSIATP